MRARVEGGPRTEEDEGVPWDDGGKGAARPGCAILYLWRCEWQPGKAKRSISFPQPRAVSHPVRRHTSTTHTSAPHHLGASSPPAAPPQRHLFYPRCFLPDRSIKVCQSRDDRILLNTLRAEIKSRGRCSKYRRYLARWVGYLASHPVGFLSSSQQVLSPAAELFYLFMYFIYLIYFCRARALCAGVLPQLKQWQATWKPLPPMNIAPSKHV